MPYKHILWATDLQETSEGVRERVEGFLQREKPPLLSLVHVVEPIYGLNEVSAVEWQEEVVTQARKKLKKLAGELKLPKERVFLQIGSPKREIVRVAEQKGADLIIVGSHGRHGVQLMLLGSTASAVLHHATCDVLAVRVHEGTRSSPLTPPEPRL